MVEKVAAEQIFLHSTVVFHCRLLFHQCSTLIYQGLVQHAYQTPHYQRTQSHPIPKTKKFYYNYIMAKILQHCSCDISYNSALLNI